jgi:hypothetical protein
VYNFFNLGEKEEKKRKEYNKTCFEGEFERYW